MPERRTFGVKHNRNVIGLPLTAELHQHIRKAIDGIRRKPFRVRQFPYRVEGSIDIITAVNEKELLSFCILFHYPFDRFIFATRNTPPPDHIVSRRSMFPFYIKNQQ